MLKGFKPTCHVVIATVLLFLILPTYAHTTTKVTGLCPLDSPVQFGERDCEKIEGDCFCYKWQFMKHAGYLWIKDLVTSNFEQLREYFQKATFYLFQLLIVAYLLSCLIMFGASKIKRKKGHFKTTTLVVMMLAVFMVLTVGKELSWEISPWLVEPNINITGTNQNPEFQNLEIKGYRSGPYARTEIRGNNKLDKSLKNFRAVFNVYGPFGVALGEKSYQLGGYIDPDEHIQISQYFNGFKFRFARSFDVRLDYEVANVNIEVWDVEMEEISWWRTDWRGKVKNLEDKDFESIRVYMNCDQEDVGQEDKTFESFFYIEDGIKAGEIKDVDTYITDMQSLGALINCRYSARPREY